MLSVTAYCLGRTRSQKLKHVTSGAMASLSLFVNAVRRFPPRRRTRMLTGRCGFKNALPRMTVTKPLSPEIIAQALGLGMRIC